MNLTLVAAIALLLLWCILVFALLLGSGPVQLLYAVSVVLFARRIIAGAPKFLSCRLYFFFSPPNSTPTVSGRNFLAPPEVWTLTYRPSPKKFIGPRPILTPAPKPYAN